MKETAAAQRYSRALFMAARDRKVPVSDALKQVQAVAQLLRVDDALRASLSHALMPVERKAELLRQTYKKLPGSVSPIVANFFDLLLRKKRLALLPLIALDLDRAVDESNGVLKAYVKSAQALDDKSKKEMEQKLTKMFGRQTVVETSVDEELLAGAVIRAGDTVIDNSLRSQLKNLKSRLEHGY